MTDEEGNNALEDETALLRANHIRKAICGGKGLLAWTLCSTMLFVYGVILVKLLVLTSGRASQFSGVSLAVSLLSKTHMCSRR